MIRHSDLSAALVTVLFLAIILIGPLPFGGILPREQTALQVAAFLALALALISRRSLERLNAIKWPLIVVLAFAGWGVLQSLPWPLAIGDLLSPRIAQSWRDASELVDALPATDIPVADATATDATATGSTMRSAPLSIAPTISRSVALQWLAIAACFAAAGLVASERICRRLATIALLAAAAFQVFYGVEGWLGRRAFIWGTEVAGNPGRLRGTFVNPDHFAFFVAIITACCAAFMWWSFRRGFKPTTMERRLLHFALPLLAFLVFFVGLSFSGSRSALVAIVLALMLQGALLSAYYRRWQLGLVGFAIVLFGLGGISLFSWQRGLGRWLATSAWDVTWGARSRVYGASFDLWLEAPWTGTGLGTFRQAFPFVQPTDLGNTWHHAHSDVLELMVTTGILAWPLLGLALVCLYRQLWQVFLKGRRSEDRAAGLAAMGAISVAFLHSSVDFALTMPANAYLLAIIVGLACGTPTFESSKKRREPESVFLDPEASSQPFGDEVAARARASRGATD